MDETEVTTNRVKNDISNDNQPPANEKSKKNKPVHSSGSKSREDEINKNGIVGETFSNAKSKVNSREKISSPTKLESQSRFKLLKNESKETSPKAATEPRISVLNSRVVNNHMTPISPTTIPISMVSGLKKTLHSQTNLRKVYSVGRNYNGSTERLAKLSAFQIQIDRAMKENRIYTVVGHFPQLKTALKRRGWVEKNYNLGILRPINSVFAGCLNLRGYNDDSEQNWTNRILRDYPPDFIWIIRRDNVDFRRLLKEQMINRFPRATFTTKTGIHHAIQKIHWFAETGISEVLFPRCYRLSYEEEKTAFINDYRMTACISLLKWLVSTFEREGEPGVMSHTGKVSSICVDFCCRHITNYIHMRRHEDIDWHVPSPFLPQHWIIFLNQYYNVVFKNHKLMPKEITDTAKGKYLLAKSSLKRLTPFWPQMELDGINNLWICKPAARSRGNGIIIMNEIDKIMDLVSTTMSREANWVVQKYIERPLVIYKTKFDIRQWFLMTDANPLTIWFYKDCYFRFCSKPFTLENFHESVHLCNNAVQSKYQIDQKRDVNLPPDNMWDLNTFMLYMKKIGKAHLWNEVIYPKMKEAIVGVLLSSQDSQNNRKNCFELFGADFMITEDFRPWLIEINSSPCMSSTTHVTAKMCSECLEDVIKVIVDKKKNPHADTGKFELIYKQGLCPLTNVTKYHAMDLTIFGKRIRTDIDWPSLMLKHGMRLKPRDPAGKKKSLRSLNDPEEIEINSKWPTGSVGERDKNFIEKELSQELTFKELMDKLRLKEEATFNALNAIRMEALGKDYDAEARKEKTISNRPKTTFK